MKNYVVIFALLLIPCLAFADTVIIDWPVQVETPTAPITGFKVYQGQASGAYGVPKDVGKVQTYSANCPQQTLMYNCFFAISAYNSIGESGKSNEVSKTIPALPVVLGTPTNFKAVTAQGKTTLTWDAVPGATGYLLRVHQAGTSYDPCSLMAVCSGLLPTMTYTIALQPGTYDAWVHAATSQTVFGPSQGLTFTVVADTVPAKPSGVTVR